MKRSTSALTKWPPAIMHSAKMLSAKLLAAKLLPALLLPAITILVLMMAGCQVREQNSAAPMTEETKAEVSEALENIVLSFLRSWEPPFYPDSALALFTRTEDFSLV
ncbi:MAG: hypothetical protein ACWGNV_15630, partial [Bacteroidales bacterium]